MAFTVAIVGRPNVGKSTLFNRLVGRRAALVDERPGLTRDRRVGDATLYDLSFTVIDTAGLEEASAQSLEARMRAQTEAAVRDADLVLFVIDARDGLTSADRHFAGWLRRLGKPIVAIANKCESNAARAGIAEAYGLGFGEPIAISAEHALGLVDLYSAIREAAGERANTVEGGAEAVDPATRPIRLAVVGRPNVGKSTTINRLLGEDRVLTGPEPGITRDSIALPWQWRGRSFVLVDTAGLRRKARIEDRVEKLAVGDTIGTIRQVHVVVLMIDATMLLEKQDLQIARLIIEEGRAIVLAANKWDLIEDGPATLKRLRDRLEISLPQTKGMAVVTVSALAGTRLDRLMEAVAEAHDVWNTDLPTPKLNRWLAGATEAHPPPLVSGRRPRLRFARQVAQRPPTIAIFGNKLTTLPDDYMRYLTNSLRETFELPGTPIRFVLKASKNPFVDEE
ncbi:MAG: ribosome biogenesis GTPase Der [Alphaproteobacteria bacterium]|nr:ribosome biogenesis GTPase Der [Alphaproteobacteria bacterium]